MLWTVLLCLLAAVGGSAVLRGRNLDPAERIGLGGILGLGALGWVTFWFGLAGGLRLAWAFLGLVVVLTAVTLWLTRYRWSDWRFRLSAGPWLLAPAALFLLLGIATVNSLAPSDTMDWDSLAYHFAVPKLWIADGRMTYIPFIHHSNFPFIVENLYIWGLQWGGTSGAKLFTVAYFVFGITAVFGLARRCSGSVAAGWWAALLFASAPVVLWESGSGYIDVAHGLFAGLGILYVARGLADGQRHEIWLGAILLGFAVGSKYTGLQVVLAALLAAAIFAIARRSTVLLGRLVAVGLVAVIIGSPWYVRNVMNTGNPVYPFFYERLGGKDWDAWRAAIYRDEQQTFGVGRTDTGRAPAALPHAVLGLAYQPGRYINPAQTEGGGFPMGAVGCAEILALLFSSALRRRSAMHHEQGVVFGAIGLSLLMWFFLSQQSRYLTAIIVPVAVLGGVWLVQSYAKQAVSRFVLGATIVGQTVFTLWLLQTAQLSRQLPVVLGRETREDYLRSGIGFYEPALALNKMGKGVALYDEVFGYLLDVPYFWANPGHCTLIPYDKLETGDDLADQLLAMDLPLVYMSLQHQDRATIDRFARAAGLTDASEPYSSEERDALGADLRTKWKFLLADAASKGRIRLVQGFPSGLIWEVRPK